MSFEKKILIIEKLEKDIKDFGMLNKDLLQ
jgi:hypothetical protein